MYELQDINPELVTNFYKAIAKVFEKENGYDLLSKTIKETLLSLEPEMPLNLLQTSVDMLIEPVKETNKNQSTRSFVSQEEAEKIYYKTYKKIIKEAENSKEDWDKYNLVLIDYIYDLLPYDKVSIINGKEYLYSFINLTLYAEKHLIALDQLEDTLKVKPPEKNIDTATNTNKASKDKVKFLTEQLQTPILNPHYDSKKEEVQLNFLKYYDKESAMIARTVYIYSKILTQLPNQFEAKVIGELEPFVNSDRLITKKDIYMSWYAHAISVYKRSSNNTIPIEKALKIAELSSKVLFESLRKRKKSLCSIETARKPIRERSFYKGLRLCDFSDNRLKIKRSQEEIDFFTEYLTLIIKQINHLSLD